jgi:hypothetical protein
MPFSGTQLLSAHNGTRWQTTRLDAERTISQRMGTAHLVDTPEIGSGIDALDGPPLEALARKLPPGLVAAPRRAAAGRFAHVLHRYGVQTTGHLPGPFTPSCTPYPDPPKPSNPRLKAVDVWTNPQ